VRREGGRHNRQSLLRPDASLEGTFVDAMRRSLRPFAQHQILLPARCRHKKSRQHQITDSNTTRNYVVLPPRLPIGRPSLFGKGFRSGIIGAVTKLCDAISAPGSDGIVKRASILGAWPAVDLERSISLKTIDSRLTIANNVHSGYSSTETYRPANG